MSPKPFNSLKGLASPTVKLCSHLHVKSTPGSCCCCKASSCFRVAWAQMVMQKSASRQKPSSIQPGMHSQADSLPLFRPPFEPGKRTSITILSKTSPRQWCFHILPLGTNSSHLQSLRPCMACPSARRSQIKSQQLGSCQRSLHCVNSSRQRACRLLAACLRGPHYAALLSNPVLQGSLGSWLRPG